MFFEVACLLACLRWLAREPPETPEHPKSLENGSWEPLEGFLAALGASWGRLGASWASLGGSWGSLGVVLAPLGPLLAALGALLAALGALLSLQKTPPEAVPT